VRQRDGLAGDDAEEDAYRASQRPLLEPCPQRFDKVKLLRPPNTNADVAKVLATGPGEQLPR
jgi:hypothetical protein